MTLFNQPNVLHCNMGPRIRAGSPRPPCYRNARASRPRWENAMAKGQKSNKEIRKPKKEQPKKPNASNPSVK